MVSAAEQLASNLNFSAFAKAEDLKRRLWFTLGALIVFRLGTFIPLPGINPAAFAETFKSQAGGILGMFNMFSGGALQRLAIFSLNIMPYISASIIMQLMSSISPKLEALKKEGEAGRKQINQYTRYLTVVLAALQAYGIAVGLEGSRNAAGAVVLDPGIFFRATTVITLVGGTVFLMWLGEQITQRGVGNGTSLIIFAGIVAGLPGALVQLFELSRTGSISPGILVFFLALALAVVAAIVFFERAQRRLLVQYPKRQVGNKMFQGEASHLPLKLNSSGVIPPIFASSLLLLPITVAQFTAGQGPEWLNEAVAALGSGQPLHMLVYALLILFFAVNLGIATFPSTVYDSMTFLERLKAIALPVTTLVLVVLAHMMRMTRAAILSVMSSAYVETAELKGLSSLRIIARHAAPNAIAPVITVVALNLAYLVVGVVVVEVVFVYPGMGQYMVDAVTVRDMPVVQACGLIFAAFYILLNMAADILAILANPRLRHPR